MFAENHVKRCRPVDATRGGEYPHGSPSHASRIHGPAKVGRTERSEARRYLGAGLAGVASLRPLYCWQFILSGPLEIASGCIGFSNYLGYYDICYIGDEVRNFGKVIPRSIFISLLAIAICYVAMNLSVCSAACTRRRTSLTSRFS